ncbi:MAG: SDR family NAD(P)-dependent oxidoreductase [Dehalococcoidia bacterium]
MRGLNGRVAAITGGARGMGRATAERLAAEGTKIAILDILEDEAKKTAEEISKSAGVEAGAWKADTTNEAELAAAFKGIEERFGGLDILVNNAGLIAPRKDWQSWTAEEVERFAKVNYIGYFNTIKAAYPLLKKSGRNGRVINVASRTFFMGNVGQTPYVSAKGAVIGLSWNMSKELGGDGITVNAVMPGQVATPGTRQYVDEEMFNRTMQNQAIKERVEPEHLADLITFLASDDAKMISGQSIVCDGGGLLH